MPIAVELPDSALRQLMDRLVGQSPGPRHDANVAFLVNVSWHDPDLALARRNNARTVRPDQPRPAVLQEVPRAHHIERRNALGDAHDEFDFGVRRLHDRVRRVWWRHKNDCGVRARLVRCFLHRIEDRPALVGGAALAWSNATHNLRAISSASFRVKRTLASGQPLHH